MENSVHKMMGSEKMFVVYVAGAYRGTPAQIKNNIQKARAVCIELWRHGLVALSPHLNSAHFDSEPNAPSDEMFLKGTLELLKRCDVMYVFDEGKSAGVRAEIDTAYRIGIRVFRGYDNLIDWCGKY